MKQAGRRPSMLSNAGVYVCTHTRFLSNYVKSCLLKNKIKNIESINIDTFDIDNNLFSARRALRLNHDDYGRNISIIMLN